MTQLTTARPEQTSQPTPEESVARGKAARIAVPRAGHAELGIGPGRADPVALLEGQGLTRVPELLPIRYGRMASSPFAYFRGAALPMAADLARTPRTGFTVQACGDAHLANFGLFASPERNLVFSLNDFDETLPGPWEWDVKRLAASLEVAGRSRNFPAKDRRRIVRATVCSYRRAMREFAGMDALAVWYAHVEMSRMAALSTVRPTAGERKLLARTVERARTKDNLGALGRFASMEEGHPRLKAEEPVIVPVRDLVAQADRETIEQRLRALLSSYAQSLSPERRVLLGRYRLVDMARKVVGVGSVGTRCWMLLLLEQGHNPLFLQVKEAEPSILEPFVGASEYDTSGQRVVVGQRLMQAVSDIFLGWVRAVGLDGLPHDYYVRQLRDWKGAVEIDAMNPGEMQAYGEVCGWTLARAHARSGDRIAMAAYLGGGDSFDEAVREYAEGYADQNERDHRALLGAIRSGRLTAETGV